MDGRRRQLGEYERFSRALRAAEFAASRYTHAAQPTFKQPLFV